MFGITGGFFAGTGGYVIRYVGPSLDGWWPRLHLLSIRRYFSQTSRGRFSIGLLFQTLAQGGEGVKSMFENPVITFTYRSEIGRGIAYQRSKLAFGKTSLHERDQELAQPRNVFAMRGRWCSRLRRFPLCCRPPARHVRRQRRPSQSGSTPSGRSAAARSRRSSFCASAPLSGSARTPSSGGRALPAGCRSRSGASSRQSLLRLPASKRRRPPRRRRQSGSTSRARSSAAPSTLVCFAACLLPASSAAALSSGGAASRLDAAARLRRVRRLAVSQRRRQVPVPSRPSRQLRIEGPPEGFVPSRDFFLRPTVEVAREVLGGWLLRRVGTQLYAARVVEVEAYLGVEDPAAHSHGGRRTARNEPMYANGGHLYVFLVYGMHCCANLVTREEGRPEAVLLRARSRRQLSTDRRFLSGPASSAERSRSAGR